jgi:hypothetical protein
MTDKLVEKIANAVLYEGYILYPYRATATKNRQRWNFGALYPPAFSEAQPFAAEGVDACVMQTQCLVSAQGQTAIDAKVRFLHLVMREVGKFEAGPLDADSSNGDWEEAEYARVETLYIDGQMFQSWQEAVERNVDVSNINLHELIDKPLRREFDFPSSSNKEALRDQSGKVAGVVVRAQQAIKGAIELSVEEVSTDSSTEDLLTEKSSTENSSTGDLSIGGDERAVDDPRAQRLFKLTVRALNLSPLESEDAQNREAALMRSMISTHTILCARGGQFISLLDPPSAFADAARSCRNIGTWPVLVGEQAERDTMLSSPIILYDYPQIAPESAGELFDSTEIDEILTLRIMTLTDEEKREMRATDERARRILERTETLPPEQLMKLHGAVRGLQKVKESGR